MTWGLRIHGEEYNRYICTVSRLDVLLITTTIDAWILIQFLQSLLLSLRLDLNDLIHTLVVWHIDIKLFRHRLAQKPPAHKVTSLEPLHQRLRSCQTNQCVWIVLAAWSRIRRSAVNIPG